MTVVIGNGVSLWDVLAAKWALDWYLLLHFWWLWATLLLAVLVVRLLRGGDRG